ncbi:hypothetical protein QFC22_002259 [Naganishia vaughanmartiniae]|uniref:Uncharacterized protein n=1 Tax=Naganishia vaughanmartiniae TaxID=1424756 RepID=A0ACC2XDX8_9TREE|nr:hypothetical protein QFC22_002259 [Naganishia vaughanmartiniae]
MTASSIISAYATYVLSFVLRAVMASIGFGMPRARQIVLVTPRKPSVVALRRLPPKSSESSAEETTVSRFIAENCPSLKPEPGFKPAWWLNSGHLQTAYAVIGNFNNVDKVEYERELIRLPDGGTIAVDITPPHHDNLAATAPTVIVAHGLTGGSYESYVRNILEWVVRPKAEGGLGGRGVVANYRGCAGAPLTSPQYYSAGYTGDYHTVVNYVHARFPQSPLLGVGFSLGASVLARYMGEQGDSCLLSAGCVLGCPWDIPAMSKTLETGFLSSRIYSKAMAGNLIRVFNRNMQAADASHAAIWDSASSPIADIHCVINNLQQKGRHLRLKDVDEFFTAKVGGLHKKNGGVFPLGGADDYYQWASSKKFITNVRRPLLAVNAFDDPIIDGRSLPLEEVQSSTHVVMAVTPSGGHLGWFDGPFAMKPGSDPKKTGYPQQRWIVKPVSEFFDSVIEGMELQENAKSADRRVIQGDDGWEWVQGSEGDTYGRVGWKEVSHGEHIKGAGSSGILQGL